jgi:hypothetical protein
MPHFGVFIPLDPLDAKRLLEKGTIIKSGPKIPISHFHDVKLDLPPIN